MPFALIAKKLQVKKNNQVYDSIYSKKKSFIFYKITKKMEYIHLTNQWGQDAYQRVNFVFYPQLVRTDLRPIVLIHGGCWSMLNPTVEYMYTLAEVLAQQGHLVALVSYRVYYFGDDVVPTRDSNRNAVTVIRNPFQDVTKGVEVAVTMFIQIQSEYGINILMDKIVILGHSVGGMMAFTLSVYDSPIDCIYINVAGPLNLQMVYEAQCFVENQQDPFQQFLNIIDPTPGAAKQVIVAAFDDSVVAINKLLTYGHVAKVPVFCVEGAHMTMVQDKTSKAFLNLVNIIRIYSSIF